MDIGVARRIKNRSRERSEIMKRKKQDMESKCSAPEMKRRKKKKSAFSDTGIEYLGVRFRPPSSSRFQDEKGKRVLQDDDCCEDYVSDLRKKSKVLIISVSSDSEGGEKEIESVNGGDSDSSSEENDEDDEDEDGDYEIGKSESSSGLIGEESSHEDDDDSESELTVSEIKLQKKQKKAAQIQIKKPKKISRKFEEINSENEDMESEFEIEKPVEASRRNESPISLVKPASSFEEEIGSKSQNSKSEFEIEMNQLKFSRSKFEKSTEASRIIESSSCFVKPARTRDEDKNSETADSESESELEKKQLKVSRRKFEKLIEASSKSESSSRLVKPARTRDEDVNLVKPARSIEEENDSKSENSKFEFEIENQLKFARSEFEKPIEVLRKSESSSCFVKPARTRDEDKNSETGNSESEFDLEKKQLKVSRSKSESSNRLVKPVKTREEEEKSKTANSEFELESDKKQLNVARRKVEEAVEASRKSESSSPLVKPARTRDEDDNLNTENSKFELEVEKLKAARIEIEKLIEASRKPESSNCLAKPAGTREEDDNLNTENSYSEFELEKLEFARSEKEKPTESSRKLESPNCLAKPARTPEEDENSKIEDSDSEFELEKLKLARNEKEKPTESSRKLESPSCLAKPARTPEEDENSKIEDSDSEFEFEKLKFARREFDKPTESSHKLESPSCLVKPANACEEENNSNPEDSDSDSEFEFEKKQQRIAQSNIRIQNASEVDDGNKEVPEILGDTDDKLAENEDSEKREADKAAAASTMSHKIGDKKEKTASKTYSKKISRPDSSMKNNENGENAAKKKHNKRMSHWRNVKRLKESNVIKRLVDSIWKEGEFREGEEACFSFNGKDEEEEEDRYELLPIKPPPPLIQNWLEEPKPVEKTESEKEIDKLWEEMAFCLRLLEMGSEESLDDVEEDGDEHSATLCSKGKHELILDIEIGLKCRYCGFIDTEIEHVVPEWGKICSEGRRKRATPADDHASLLDRVRSNEVGSNDRGNSNHSKGTVWDVIPGIKNTMYPHQQEGFEFIWRNLAGTIQLDELKNSNRDDTGGCIISHAPGTGKTRLTLVFLQAFLEVFPNCRPVIIAPASLLLTWEEEFKKWNINVPFYNLNNLEFMGKENDSAEKIFDQKTGSKSMNTIRIVKLFSWNKKQSVLGVSYSLYEKLAGDKCRKEEKKATKESEDISKILLEKPGLIILDEGHTPRNQRSQIWKILKRVKTEKRIILSGTPFQNNFLELSNVLCIARPNYTEKISSVLKRRRMNTVQGGRKRRNQKDETLVENKEGIEELKALMAPFVNVHEGEILQKSLPGLIDCVVVLNAQDFQKKILDGIETSQSVFEVEHKLSVVSVHPSLLSHCSLTKKEQNIFDQALLDKLQELKSDMSQGIKTRFLVEFIKLCDAMNEKVLVFSQFIDPLTLIMTQLHSLFGWSEGREVFFIHGKQDQKQRQTLINRFNDPKSSDVKLILASIKACSEGINLVGASRVVLLDVVWNPSVERQAISRAYRIGQRRVVYTYHLVIKGMSECEKYCKQAEKDRISELVFSTGNVNGNVKKGEQVVEDRVLDEMVKHVKLQDMFEKLIYQPKVSNLIEGFRSDVH